jgi:hypothetical protein
MELFHALPFGQVDLRFGNRDAVVLQFSGSSVDFRAVGNDKKIETMLGELLGEFEADALEAPVMTAYEPLVVRSILLTPFGLRQHAPVV